MLDVMDTKTKLVAMLTENTGRSFLDSGDAYGRAWERNQGRDVASFEAGPAVLIDEYGAALDVFHYLVERVDFDAELDAVWRAFDDAHPDESWFETADAWTAEVGEQDGYWSTFGWQNSYNGDNCLNGTIQLLPFTYGGGSYVLLQIHGGADVRGGYTRPAVFATDESIFSWNDLDLNCSKGCGYVRLQGSYLVDATVDVPEGWEPQHGCTCGAPMQ
jgi:hypothetical protein